MFDLNAIVSAAITEVVNARITEVLQQHANTVGALVERIVELETIKSKQADYMGDLSDRIATLETNETYLTQRITALETKLTEAKLFERTSNVTIPIDKDALIDHLNDQEWFWSKLRNFADAAAEAMMNDHLETYDHDSYDDATSKVDDVDFDDFVTKGDLEEAVTDQVNECLGNAEISIRV